MRNIFSTSVNIQLLISVVLFVLMEIVGVWFLNNVLNIPVERIGAANWIIHCSILTFCVGLITIPYNALIVAHERMSAFAYISILEAVLKLVVVYLLCVLPWDKLILYGVLILVVSVIIRFVYSIYCSFLFKEAHYILCLDKSLFKQMAGFAGWNFFGQVCGTLNTQGLNMLINIFFGVAVNAARGIAVQIETAVTSFATNFTIAINPQITKNYASGNTEEMIKLVVRGTKFSFFIMYILAVPLIIETDTILQLWLKTVPTHTVTFVRLTLFAAMINMMANPCYTAIQATGKIKRYAIEVNSVSILVFPLTLLAYYLGAKPYMAYVVLIIIRLCLHVVRLRNLRLLMVFPIRGFLYMAWGRSLIVAVTSLVVPILLHVHVHESLCSFMLMLIVSVLSTAFCIWVFGMERSEREFVGKQVGIMVNSVKKK